MSPQAVASKQREPEGSQGSSTVIMRKVAAIGLALVIGLALPGDAQAMRHGRSRHTDDDAPRGNPIDLEFTLAIRLPDEDWSPDTEAVPCSRWITVPGVVEGQRVPVPKRADGTCPRRVKTEILSDLPTQVEFEPEGCMDEVPSTCTHWIQHAISAETSEYFDEDRCEVVIERAIARDDVHRKVLRRLTPIEIDHFLGQPPTPADLSADQASGPPVPGFEEE